MARLGIASIRMDFPGCGDSSESFTENNLSNMLLDLRAARVFAESQPGIDSDRVGLLGYSMGGRLVALLSEIDPSYKVMVMWTPAVGRSFERGIDLLGGPDAYQDLKKRAQETGSAIYTTRWGTSLELGYQWFVDLEEMKPLEALTRFEGPLLVIYGDQDDVVLPATSESAIAAAQSSSEVVRHVIADAEHALGIYTNKPEIAADAVGTTAKFLGERL
jgi:dienelactone hydrolase